jgi:hypothetical protein
VKALHVELVLREGASSCSHPEVTVER